ncbi:MAG: hypothetical protein KDA85_13285, partial [Planctomycetaceae bacterium]|nr:hypothetical protein [Planctomycetaceae bacterium]
FSDYEFSHAESSYIHLAMETGLLGFSCLAVGLLLIGLRIVTGLFRNTSHPRRFAMAATAVAGLTGGMVHAAADFIWYAPAIVVTTIVLIVTTLRTLSGFSVTRAIPIPRIAWLAAAGAAGFGLVTVQPELEARVAGEREWNQYLLVSQQIRQEKEADQGKTTEKDLEQIFAKTGENSSQLPLRNVSHSTVASTPSREDTAHYETTDATRSRESIDDLKLRMNLLIRSLQENGHQPRVRLRLAQLCLELFDVLQETSDNPLPLAHLRDAAISSQFQSEDELAEWMNRAFGKHVRLLYMADQLSRESLRQCPVQGNAYLYLLETGFLRNPKQAFDEKLVDQALLVRGHDPRIHFAVGRHALSLGQEQEAIEQWNAVFHANSEYRILITRIMATQVPSIFVLSQFNPNLSEIVDVLAVYQQKGNPANIAPIVAEIERLAESETTDTDVELRIHALMQAHAAAATQGMNEKAEQLVRKAVSLDESAYWPRRGLAVLLFEKGQFDEAAEHLLFCHH